jgi:CRP/FNR family cyclic AMP-dependent transcriptional regulator
LDEYPSLASLLQGMTDEIKQKTSMFKLPRLSALLLQDATIEYVYLVCSGRLVVEYLRENGMIYDFVEVVVGDFVGEMEVINGQDSSQYTVRAIIDCEILRIPRDSFILWLNSDSKLTLHLLKIISGKWSGMAYALSEYTYYDAIYKVSAFILNNLLIESDYKKEYIVKCTRQAIADQLGLNVRTINRAVKSLASIGCIFLLHGKIYITADCYSRLIDFVKNIKLSARLKNYEK